MEVFGVAVVDGVGEGVQVGFVGVDNAGDAARDGFAADGVAADGALVAVRVAEGERFVVLAPSGVDVVQFCPGDGEVQFAAAEGAVEEDAVEVALARVGECEVQAVAVAAGDGAVGVGEGVPEEAGGAEGEERAEDGEGEADVGGEGEQARREE